jgi:hypothetical protein
MWMTWTNRSGWALLALAMAFGDGCSSSLPGGDGAGGHAGNGTAGVSGGGAGGQGIPGTDGGVLACRMSVEQACAGFAPVSCDLTWSAVQTDTSLCTPNNIGSRIYVSDCVGYHVLGYYGIDSGTDFYYDSTTGALVAIVDVGFEAAPPCVGGPTAGFVPPSDCTTQTAPPQCTGDAGDPDAAKG